MEKVKIELPQVIEVSAPNSSKRTAMFEYTQNGLIISKDEAETILQKWIDHIKKMVPQSEIDTNGYVELLESPRESVVSSKNSLIKYYALLGKEVPKDMLNVFDEKIANLDKSTQSQFKVHLVSAIWQVKDSDGTNFIISSIDLRFYGSDAIALVWLSNDKDEQYDSRDYSWSEGVKMYLENGKKWLQKYAPEMEIPLPQF